MRIIEGSFSWEWSAMEGRVFGRGFNNISRIVGAGIG